MLKHVQWTKIFLTSLFAATGIFLNYIYFLYRNDFWKQVWLHSQLYLPFSQYVFYAIAVIIFTLWDHKYTKILTLICFVSLFFYLGAIILSMILSHAGI
jgi:hypothetical protein